MIKEGFGGVIGRANGVDLELIEKAVRTKGVILEAFIGLIPDGLGAVWIEQSSDPKAATEFQMSPVEERVANATGNCFSPGLEFFAGRRVPGNMRLRYSIRPHGSPLVVIFAEPESTNVSPALVLCHFPGRKVGMVINDWQGRCDFMEEALGCGAPKKEVFIHEGSCHSWMLEVDGRVVNRNLSEGHEQEYGLGPVSGVIGSSLRMGNYLRILRYSGFTHFSFH